MYKALVILSGVGLSIASLMDAARTANAGGSSGIGFATAGSVGSPQDAQQGDIMPATLRGGPHGAADARRQIRQEPLSPLALALIAQEKGVDKQSGLELAERMTRRHSALQLELVNAAAMSGDMVGAVAHLDKALRVRPQLGKDILPKLVPAIADPEFRKAIRAFAVRPWVWQYLAMAGKDEGYRENAAAFVIESRDVVLAAKPSIQQSAMKTLMIAERFREAQDLIVASGAISRKAMETITPIAENSMQGFEPLTWTLANSEVAQVHLSDDGTWEATIEPGRQASLMQRVTILNVGNYRMVGKIRTDDERAELRMTLRCVSNNFEIAAAGWQPQLGQSLTIETSFRVPDGCTRQLWMLDLSSLGTSRTTTLNARRFALMPVKQ